MSIYLEKIRASSTLKLEELQKILDPISSQFALKACVYATGSFGRLEAGPNSDLDLFIVSDMGRDNRCLKNLDEIALQYHLIQAVKSVDLPDFDRDGAFLKAHTIQDYVESLGGPHDDAKNTFTGRLLLLLESKPVLGDEVYRKLINAVVSRYFRDYSGHEENFRPAFLINDILRMWRTFCVNYEHSRKPVSDAKGKMKNLKLKYCRMITCYSAILYLTAVYAENNTVREADVYQMISHSPTDRLLKVRSMLAKSTAGDALAQSITEALSSYGNFIQYTHSDRDENQFDRWHTESYEFSAAMEGALKAVGKIGRGNEMLRLVLI